MKGEEMQQIKLDCLRLAFNVGVKPEKMLETAGEYYRFIMGADCYCCQGEPEYVVIPEDLSGIPSYALGDSEGAGKTTTKVAMETKQKVPSMNRDECKHLLREKGIKFKEAARTETLFNLLTAANVSEKAGPVDTKEEHVASMATTQEAPPVITPAEAALLPTGEVFTEDDVRNALIKLSARTNKDVALKVLADTAATTKLSQVPAEKYGAIIKACEVANG